MKKLVLGTVQFGLDYGINNFDGKPNFEDICQMLDLAFHSDIKLLDTAEAYGDAHQIIGRYHKLGRNQFNIITKFNSNQKNLPTSLVNRINLHLKDLHIDMLEGFMYHSYKDYKNFIKEHLSDIKELKKTNKIQNVGVSLHSNEDLLDVVEDNNIDFIQLPFNLLDNSNHRLDVFAKAKKKNKQIHVRSVFLQGLFFRELNSIQDNIVALKPYLKKIKQISTESQIPTDKLALNYVYHQEYIDKVLFGVQNIDQLNTILTSLDNSPKLMNPVFNRIEKEIKVTEISLLNPATWAKK